MRGTRSHRCDLRVLPCIQQSRQPDPQRRHRRPQRSPGGKAHRQRTGRGAHLVDPVRHLVQRIGGLPIKLPHLPGGLTESLPDLAHRLRQLRHGLCFLGAGNLTDVFLHALGGIGSIVAGMADILQAILHLLQALFYILHPRVVARGRDLNRYFFSVAHGLGCGCILMDIGERSITGGFIGTDPAFFGSAIHLPVSTAHRFSIAITVSTAAAFHVTVKIFRRRAPCVGEFVPAPL